MAEAEKKWTEEGTVSPAFFYLSFLLTLFGVSSFPCFVIETIVSVILF